IAQACALLSERHYLPARSASTTSDLLSALDDWRTMPPHVQRVAKEIETLGKGVGSRFEVARVLPIGRNSEGKDESPTGVADARKETRPPFTLTTFSESDFRRAILTGYPDRVA